MNHRVPEFEMADEDYDLPSLVRDSKASASGVGDDVVELLWHNGRVVMQSQLSHKKPPPSDHHPLGLIPAVGSPSHHHHTNQDPPQHQQQQNDDNANNLFIQEDEMANWLLSDFCSDLLLPPSSSSPSAAAAATSTAASLSVRPPPAVPPSRRFENFGHFSRLNRSKATTADEATVVDSSITPMVARVPEEAAAERCDVARVGGGFSESTSVRVRNVVACDLTVTSSSGASSASAEPVPPTKSRKVGPPPLPPKATAVDAPDERKRKGREGSDDGGDGYNSEDIELVSTDAKKLQHGSSSTKRSRAAEVHNLSERRRRDRINEKMRALQELIPHCNKADKASMLNEAIEYLKSLQMQVQMMSMGCSMMPMMFPGVQQYMPRMGMGMGIGMGMEMGMNRPFIQFPNFLPGSTLLMAGAGAHIGPTFPIPAFHMPHIPAPDPSGIPPTDQPEAMLSSMSQHNSKQPRIPGFMNPYQQFLGLHHMHVPLQQSQENPSNSSKPSTSKVGENSQESPD